VAVHPARSHIVVAEKGLNPSIYVYALPTLTLTHVLRGGTERGYSDVNFK
jgi:hypothetical protein